MSERKFKYRMLQSITRVNVNLVLKKCGDPQELNRIFAEYAEFASAFLEKYDADIIFEKSDSFLDDLRKLKAIAEKLYATTIIWDVDSITNDFLMASREKVREKFSDMKIDIAAILRKIQHAECDENGNLLIPMGIGDIYEDKELSEQLECGHRASGYPAPIDMFEELARAVDRLEFDSAIDIAKDIGVGFYNSLIKVELNRLIKVMDEGDFERAVSVSKRLQKFAKEHNDTVAELSKTIKPRLLVVDDMPEILLTIKGVLSDICHVCTVTNETSALRFLENCHSDIILLDIELGESDGFTLLAKIKQMHRYKETPVFFITGNVSKEIILRAKDAGIDDYIKKPIDGELLIARVKKWLDLKGYGTGGKSNAN